MTTITKALALMFGAIAKFSGQVGASFRTYCKQADERSKALAMQQRQQNLQFEMLCYRDNVLCAFYDALQQCASVLALQTPLTPIELFYPPGISMHKGIPFYYLSVYRLRLSITSVPQIMNVLNRELARECALKNLYPLKIYDAKETVDKRIEFFVTWGSCVEYAATHTYKKGRI